MEQVALNTIIGIMMAVFPGFLFRKCYYSGEFTKQFNQSNELDKLLWNVFFSGISMGITFLSIYFFRSVSGLEVLSSLSYDIVTQLATPISKNEVPDKDLIYKTYKDLLIIISLIYLFSCFLGLILHWLVRSLRIDIYFPLLRFKNYWYYYIHGGKILYSNPTNRTPAFTVADVLCEIAGETKLYKGIVSQYTINKDDSNLENIFLTNARAVKQHKDENGTTVSTTLREIPGAAFCIPYKTVANMNLVYVYEDDQNKRFQKVFLAFVNIMFFLVLTLVIASLWFDLGVFGINGFWEKMIYFFWFFVGLSNLRLMVFKNDKTKSEWIGQISFLINAVIWMLYLTNALHISIAILSLTLAIFLVVFSSSKARNHND